MKREELLRYSRQIMLPDFGEERQEQLRRACVLVAGLGGLGSPAALYLAAAGVGRLILADDDDIDLGNLQRQILYDTPQLGQPKTAAARQRLEQLNPEVQLEAEERRLAGALLEERVAEVDLVLDASDNFATRFALNRACHRQRKPLVSGAAIRAEGQVAVFDHREESGPCYRCLYDDSIGDQGLNCAESGILAPVTGIIGTVQALEALKVLSGYGTSLHGRLLVLDAAAMRWKELRLSPDPACPVCSGNLEKYG